MAVATKNGFCNVCDKRGAVITNRPDHLLHLVLTVFTISMWAIVWLIRSLGGNWRCQNCGSSDVTDVV